MKGLIVGQIYRRIIASTWKAGVTRNWKNWTLVMYDYNGTMAARVSQVSITKLDSSRLKTAMHW